MKKIAILMLIFITSLATSQELALEVGKTISSFDYEDSSGNKLENIHPSNHTYLGLGYRKSISAEALFLTLNASYSGYGSIGSDKALDNYFEWDLSYVGVGVGLDYEFYKPGDFTFFIKGLGNAEFLVQGTQTLNNQVYSLPGEADFNTAIYTIRGGLGVQYEISKGLSVFNQYTYGFSGTFKEIEGKLKINSHNVGLGILIDVSKNSYKRKEFENYKVQLEELKNETNVNTETIKSLQQKLEVKEALEKEIDKKNNEINMLKSSIHNALYTYKGKDLKIEDRQDKVLITLDTSLVFDSGSTEINNESKKALQDLSDILAKNPDVSVCIEGHTDNVPFINSKLTNRDLSLQRATAIVDKLSENQNINPENLVAAGIGEFDPIADNSTEEGRAKNRRIEIVLIPKLENLKDLIKN
ncbi:OmpA family protein [Mariniflexile soesokkakense]|uniref:OmpA family protein n=1 Tax=Mariniflexile soesokkakense TaxID=1343160 RepID=A0ABV0AGF9_9FLAO